MRFQNNYEGLKPNKAGKIGTKEVYCFQNNYEGLKQDKQLKIQGESLVVFRITMRD